MSHKAPLRLQIDFVLEPRVGVPPVLLRRLKIAACQAYELVPLPLPAEVTVLFTGSRQIQILNRDYRGKDKPTNVLSFPQFTPRQIAKMGKGRALMETIYLGDIAISYPYIVAEAKKNNKILLNHAIHMILHALLHLLGYDHISEREASRMERLETKIMAALGLPDPYQPAQLMEPKPVKAAGMSRRSAGRRVK